MKTATAAIAVPIQISVQRSLLAAEVVVAVGETAPSTAAGTALFDTFAASKGATTCVVVAWVASSDLDIRNRNVNDPLDSGRGFMVTERNEAVPFRCGRVSELELHLWSFWLGLPLCTDL